MDSIDTFRSALRSEERPTSGSLARGLGWFSIALGAVQLAFPRTLSRVIGIEPGWKSSLVTRLVGMREIAAGVSVLAQPQRAWPLWARVAGDAVDLALLGLGATRRTSGVQVAGAMAVVAGVAALDVMAGVRARRAQVHPNRPVIYAVTINKSPGTVYAFFRDFTRFPELVDYLEAVTEIDHRRSRWTAKPLGTGKTVSWEAEITEDIAGQVIAWQSVEGSPVEMRGRVTFARTPGRDATEVRVEMELGFAGLGPTAAIAGALAKPQVKGDLRRLKQVLETGEVLVSDATVTRRPHPAQPSTPEVIANNPHVSPDVRPEVRS